MRDRVFGCPRGVARQIKANGDIFEFTAKDGCFHGLCRWIWGNEVRVSLYSGDEELASFRFDYNLEEIERDDPD